jgi:protein-cysteine N-palmitoyltransferase HHAT
LVSVQDYNDEQWDNWVDTLLNLSVVSMVFLALSASVRHMVEHWGWPKTSQIRFYFLTGICGGLFIHGSDVIWPLLCISLNYWITKAVRRLRSENLAVLIIWAFNFVVLISVFVVQYPRINDLIPLIGTLTYGYNGFSRWTVYYKLAMLRQISFGIDFQQAYRKNQRPSVTALNSKLPPSAAHYELADPKQFDLVSLIGYTFYLPLLIAGPIAPFSQFVRDCEKRQTQVPLRSILRMLFQVACYTLALEVWLHYIYVYSWNQQADWRNHSPAVLSMICFWTLQHMFVKFTVIWRSFRALALLDGISVVRNPRCVCEPALSDPFFLFLFFFSFPRLKTCRGVSTTQLAFRAFGETGTHHSLSG